MEHRTPSSVHVANSFTYVAILQSISKDSYGRCDQMGNVYFYASIWKPFYTSFYTNIMQGLFSAVGEFYNHSFRNHCRGKIER